MDKMNKMEDDLFYNMRHLKIFRDNTNHNGTVWSYRWPDGGEIEMYNKRTGETLFKIGHDPRFAEYVCSLHNMSGKMIKEVESKYVD